MGESPFKGGVNVRLFTEHLRCLKSIGTCKFVCLFELTWSPRWIDSLIDCLCFF